MQYIPKILIGLIALEHIYILWLEMFAWTTAGRKVFKGAMPDNMFEATKGLAANQGLYNGFLAAGLIWSLLIDDIAWSHNVAVFFISCVLTAGIYGGFTASKKIWTTQAAPAAVTLAVLILMC